MPSPWTPKPGLNNMMSLMIDGSPPLGFSCSKGINSLTSAEVGILLQQQCTTRQQKTSALLEISIL